MIICDLDFICEELNIKKRDVFITLVRIKLGLHEKFLGHHFGLAQSTISKIFTKTVPKLAQILKGLIFMPTKDQIRASNPASFKNQFSSE